MLKGKNKKKASYLYRTATTAYPCCLPTLGGSAGAGRIRLAGRKDKEISFFLSSILKNTLKTDRQLKVDSGGLTIIQPIFTSTLRL